MSLDWIVVLEFTLTELLCVVCWLLCRLLLFKVPVVSSTWWGWWHVASNLPHVDLFKQGSPVGGPSVVCFHEVTRALRRSCLFFTKPRQSQICVWIVWLPLVWSIRSTDAVVIYELDWYETDTENSTLSVVFRNDLHRSDARDGHPPVGRSVDPQIDCGLYFKALWVISRLEKHNLNAKVSLPFSLQCSEATLAWLSAVRWLKGWAFSLFLNSLSCF